MDKGSKYLGILLVLAAVVSISVAAWRYLVVHEYHVIVPEDPAEFQYDEE